MTSYLSAKMDLSYTIELVNNKNLKPVVILKDVMIKFADFTAVNKISLTVFPGEVVGVLGGNGAGKSSTLKAIAGIIKPTDGHITVSGLNLSDSISSEQAKGLMGYCPDVGGLVVGATPREHIQLLLNLHKKPELYPLSLALTEALGLAKFIDTPVGGFSHGMSRRLSVLLAALSAEKVLILDEPFDGVDPLGVIAINSVIAEAKAAGLAILVSTHLQPLLTQVSDRVIIMNRGVIIHEDSARRFSGKHGAKKYQGLLNRK
jgi:ABC-2 type transport system ATP-binding protein